MAYNAQGHATSFTQLAETSGSVTTTIAYEPTYNLVASVTDPLGHTVSYGYNFRGNLASLTNALGQKATYKYNAAAELSTATNALGKSTQFIHSLGVLVEAIDPLGNSTRQEIDAAGRTTSVINPLGEVTRYEYDNLNQQTQGTDQMAGVTAFTYDGNGNLLTVTDARNSVTSYIYDNMDRIVTRRDPLQHDDTYEYDLNGNLKKVTDRKGQITNFTYDALDRLTQVTYADTSTTTYTYDSVNRLLQIADSVSGTITYGHDNLDRLTSETTPQGAITYTYDSAGRRTSMNVPDQPTINYIYDDANRLTQITQGTSTVSFVHDAVGRRTSVTLPNGVSTEYSYDAASRLTSLTYKQGLNVLGNLTYDYDSNNRRTGVAGSLARTVFPQPLAAATYNATNQQITFGGETLNYDLNGNLTSDGLNTYTWNARNRLSSINASNLNATFAYDSTNRRVSKTINGVSTTFLYDGANIVQEQSTELGNANILNGGLDEVLMRADAAGQWNPLRDGLGSVLSLTDGSGAVQTEYTYGVFGHAAASGTSSNSSSQYTGRENDGTGLQFSRARYYHPTLQRFISEDPIGFSGGDINLYGYVANSPTNFIDPRGLDIAVIENGPTPGNPFGHTALAITGRGVFSYGNGNGGDGSNIIRDSLAEYIARESGRRRTVIWVIPTTPAQDAAAAAAGSAMDHASPVSKEGLIFDNCSSRSHGLLDAAGIPDFSDGLPRIWPGTGGGRAWRNGAGGYEIPQGSITIIPWDPKSPYDFSQFEPQPYKRTYGRK